VCAVELSVVYFGVLVKLGFHREKMNNFGKRPLTRGDALPLMRFCRIIFLLCAILHAQPLLAQHENDNWFFGRNAAITWTSGVPVDVPGGQINTYEGSTAMSDYQTGALLFYTDGYNVWTSTHQKMPHADSTLAGHFSSCQSAIILPKNCTQYYIITSDQVGNYGPNRGVNYSIVDMTLNGGLGDVTILNQPLLQPATEKLTATLDHDTTGYWLLGHQFGTSDFYAWHVDGLGFGAPVVSSIGSVYAGQLVKNIGAMMVSPNGSKLVCATETGAVELFDFNNKTGVVSHLIPLPGLQWSYGACFSPDNSKLYIGAAFQDEIDQYDLSSGDSQTIRTSRLPIWQGASSPAQLGFLQLAPDGRIYSSQENQNLLGAIRSPNLAGIACNYVVNAVRVSQAAGKTSLGLPNFCYSYVPHRPVQVSFSAPNIHARPGDTITIPITINVNPRTLAKFSIDIEINRTVLSPIDKSLPVRDSGDVRIVTITDSSSITPIIFNLRCVVALGDSQDVVLGLANQTWSAICPTVQSLRQGMFHLDSVCQSGGSRLFDPFGKFVLGQSQPNPTSGKTLIQFQTPEDTYTELFVVDILGKRVKTVIADHLKHGSYDVTFNTDNLAQGAYVYVLRTLDMTISKRLVISR
jgi:hypothetical protein